jgi:radical SAM protein with 4Fe4S-binding SPASM domain
LTHPDAAGVIRAVRSRNLPLGLYTKGTRFDRGVIEAVLEGDSECFVTFSVDAVDRENYMTTHDIPRDRLDKHQIRGEDYFEVATDNIRALRLARDRAGSSLQIRVALLLFQSSASEDTVAAAVERFAPIADLVRFALPQNRNDGQPPGDLPARPEDLLRRLADKYKDHNKVRILQATAQPTRPNSFRRCHVQRFQVVIDKAGNLFPCPQVAVRNYAHLSFGNIRNERMVDLLQSPRRRRLFNLEIDRDMKCRICDRKDEAVNIALDRFERTYAS